MTLKASLTHTENYLATRNNMTKERQFLMAQNSPHLHCLGPMVKVGTIPVAHMNLGPMAHRGVRLILPRRVLPAVNLRQNGCCRLARVMW